MIASVMHYLNNYFSRTVEKVTAVIDSSAKTITGSFGETYLAGQYIRLSHTILNDGVYKIVSVAGSVITVEEGLQDESPAEGYYLWGLAPPKPFLEVVADIETYNAANGTNTGLKSETQGKRAVTYASDSTWQGVFANALGTWRKVYSDDDKRLRAYQSRGC